MLSKEIKNFEKLLKKLSGDKIKVFDEIIEMIISLLRGEVSANHNELIKRVTKNIQFNSIESVQEFLSSYFNLQNAIIKEFESFSEIKSSKEFDKETDRFTKTILQTISKKELHVVLPEAMIKIYGTVLDTYNIDFSEDTEKTTKSIEDTFGDKDLAVLFFSTSAIIGFLKEDNSMGFDEIVKLSSPFFIFCATMNDIRKQKYLKSQEHKKQYGEPANTLNYNVGRNDPCPCGSGKKYKKCCLNKQQIKPLDTIETKEPKDIPVPLSQKEITEFYAVWSVFVNYTSKLYSEIYEKTYTPIYEKDRVGKYLVSKKALKDTYCLEVRDFLTNNFYQLIDDFLFDNKVSKKREKELLEFRDFYKSSRYHSFEKYKNGNAIFWDTQNNNCYYVNRCYDSLSTLLPKHAMFNTILLPFRGKIVCDGIIGQYNIDIGNNMQNSLKEEYEKNRNTIHFELEKNEKPADKIYQLKISIKGAKPPIWRRVLVHSNTSFYGLHSIIQRIFNWEDCHLYEFVGDLATYTDKEALKEDFGGSQNNAEADKFSIETELKTEKDKIAYTYDFGDDWEHTILLEKILTADENIDYPICTGGRREGPFEDCGGIYMYNSIAHALENPSEEIDESLEEHIGYMGDMVTDFDPSFFKKELVNRRLRGN